MAKVLKLKSDFLNMGLSKEISRYNSDFLSVLLNLLYDLDKNVTLDLSNYIGHLSEKKGRKVLSQIKNLSLSGHKMFEFQNQRSNLIVSYNDDIKDYVLLERFDSNSTKCLYMTIDLDILNKKKENLTDLDFMVFIYSKFSNKSNLFKNKSLNYLNNILKLTQSENKQLLNNHYLTISDYSNIKIEKVNNRYNIFFNSNNPIEEKIDNTESITPNPYSIQDFILNSNSVDDFNFIKENKDLIGTNHLEVFDIATSGYNTFISGIGGAGKTYLLKKIIKTLQAKGKTVFSISPTKITALNLGGETFHSLLRLRPDIYDWEEAKQYFKPEDFSSVTRKIQETDVFVIEEFGMVSDALFQTFLSAVKEYSKIGKKQFIFLGDLEQLPPVANKVLREKYKLAAVTKAFFGDSYKSLDVKNAKLEYSYRALDQDLLTLLDYIRSGHSLKAFELLNSKARKMDIKKEIPANTLVLTGRNSRVNYFNKLFHDNNPKMAHIFKNEIVDRAEGLPLYVSLKVGEPVIITQTIAKEDYRYYSRSKNTYFKTNPKNPLPNNTLGTFVGKTKENLPIVKLGDSSKCIVVKGVLSNLSYNTLDRDNNINKVWPIKLAYAFTAHKSQGLTLTGNNVYIDIEDFSFENQAYTVFSRLRNFNQVIVSNQLKYDNVGEAFKKSSNTTLVNKIFKNTKRQFVNLLSHLKNSKVTPEQLSYFNFHKLISKTEVRLPIRVKDYSNNASFLKFYPNVKVDDNGNIYSVNRDYKNLNYFLKYNKKMIEKLSYDSEQLVLFYLLFSEGLLSKEILLNLYNSIKDNKEYKRYNRIFVKNLSENGDFNYSVIQNILEYEDTTDKAVEMFGKFGNIFTEIYQSSYSAYNSVIFTKAMELQGLYPGDIFHTWLKESDDFFTTFYNLMDVFKAIKSQIGTSYWFNKAMNSYSKVLKRYVPLKKGRDKIDSHIWRLFIYPENEMEEKHFSYHLSLYQGKNLYKNKMKYLEQINDYIFHNEFRLSYNIPSTNKIVKTWQEKIAKAVTCGDDSIYYLFKNQALQIAKLFYKDLDEIIDLEME